MAFFGWYSIINFLFLFYKKTKSQNNSNRFSSIWSWPSMINVTCHMMGWSQLPLLAWLANSTKPYRQSKKRSCSPSKNLSLRTMDAHAVCLSVTQLWSLKSHHYIYLSHHFHVPLWGSASTWACGDNWSWYLTVVVPVCWENSPTNLCYQLPNQYGVDVFGW